MKFAFLKTKASIIALSLIAGLFIGFKVANTQYRREQGLSLSNQVAQASSRGAGGNSDQAVAEARAVIEKAKNSPQDVEAQLDAADQFIQIGRPEEALQFLEQAVKVDPKDARTTAGLGMVNFMMGKYDETITWAKRSLEQTPKNPGASFLLIASYIRSNKNLDEAERMIKQLETEGIDAEMIAKAREELAAARLGKASGAGVNSGSKTVLDHGPSDPKPVQKQDKSGGRQ